MASISLFNKTLIPQYIINSEFGKTFLSRCFKKGQDFDPPKHSSSLRAKALQANRLTRNREDDSSSLSFKA
jgi:hypothetical protein